MGVWARSCIRLKAWSIKAYMSVSSSNVLKWNQIGLPSLLKRNKFVEDEDGTAVVVLTAFAIVFAPAPEEDSICKRARAESISALC